MTVTTTANSISYAGNGTTTAFAFPFIFFAPTDLVVTLITTATNVPVSPAPVLNGAATYDYTVTGVLTDGEYASGGTVTFNTAPPGGYTVRLVRSIPAIQNVTLIDNTKFPANTVNTEFDYLTVLAQQSDAVAHDLSQLALHIPDVERGKITLADPAAVRSLKVLAWDSVGNLITSGKTLAQIEAGVGIGDGGVTLANTAAALPTLAALKSYVGGQITAVVNCRSVTNDGWGGIFVLDAGDTTTAGNDALIVVDNMGRRWKRIWDKVTILMAWYFAGHEADADHTPVFNAAFAALIANGGGILRLASAQYRIGACTPFTADNIWLKGNGISAASSGSVITILASAGSNPGLTWGNISPSGYIFTGGGIEGVTFTAQAGHTGYAAQFYGGVGVTVRGVEMFATYNGLSLYGGLHYYITDSRIEQNTGNWCINLEGLGINRLDGVQMVNVFLGAKSAVTGTSCVGIRIWNAVHSTDIQNVAIVNPTYGIFCGGNVIPVNAIDWPHFLTCDNLQVDYAKIDCVRLERFIEAKFSNCYFLHDSAVGSGDCVQATGFMDASHNVNGPIQIINSKMIGAQSFANLYIDCNGATVTNNVIYAPAIANLNCVFLDNDARNVTISDNLFGTINDSPMYPVTTGVRISTGAANFRITQNMFQNFVVSGGNIIVDGSTTANKVISDNSSW